MMDAAPYWLRNHSQVDREALDAAAEWLRPIPWQWFATGTFSGNIRMETATAKFREFINNLERFHKRRICMVAGMESQPCRHGIRVPWHFHMMLAAYGRISKEAIEGYWLQQASRGAGRGKALERILVERYEAHRPGVEYCMKQINGAFGEWYPHRLEEFLPVHQKPNHRTLRRARRAHRQGF